MTTLTETTDDFVAAARGVLGARGGAGALDELDWWELTTQLDDLTCRLAVFALFRAQGHELATTPALGGVLAQPYLDLLDAAPGEVLGSIVRRSRRRGDVTLVFGTAEDLAGRRLLVDGTESGLTLVDVDSVELHPVDLPGRLAVHEVRGVPHAPLGLDPDATAAARVESTRLARTALASEMLGAAEGAVDMAVAYAGTRQQFGTPIGTFQAVRHLLAWARTETTAVGAVLQQAEALHHDAGERYDEVVKAIAGRNAKLACERSMQVLGGVAFTSELDHHHFHSRVLQLDGLLGTSADLTHSLGAWVRQGSLPDYTTRALRPVEAV